jgi:NhaP-type Na+/H+ or K+/H+ antiporter
MDPLIVLTYIAIVLMIGVLASIVAKILKIPYPLLLIVLGMILGATTFQGSPLIAIDETFTMGIGVLALVMLAFDSSSRLKFKEHTGEAISSMKIIRYFLLLSIVIMTFFTAALIFGQISLVSVVFSLLFAIMAVETDLGSVLMMFKEYAKEKADRIMFVLETEANLNTPVVIVLPFLVLELIASLNFNSESMNMLLLSNLPRFFFLLVMSVGVGLIVGLILLKFMKDRYSPQFSPVAIIGAILVAYLLSANLGGDGILAVATMGLIFGNVYVKGKEQLEEFSIMLSRAIEIIIFVMVGLVIKVPFTTDFILRSLFLFAVLILIRIVAVSTVLKQYTSAEKIFISLNMTKGITIATVVLVLSTFHYTDITAILQLMVMFMIYSFLTSLIVDLNARKLLGHHIEKASTQIKRELGIGSEFSMQPATDVQAKPRKKSASAKRPKTKSRSTRKAPAKKTKPVKKPARPAKKKQKVASRRKKR